MSEIHLSVIIPAYNEERRLPKTLEEIDKYLNKQTYEYEILVVNDGSKDRTVEVAKSLLPKIRNLKVTGYEINQGKGYAVRFGMLEAKGEYRLFTDADNSTSIDQIEKMWPYFKEGYDIVIGSRDIKGAVLDPPQPWLRQVLLGEGFKLYRKIIIGLWEIEDTQCGFKGFTKRAVEDIFPRCKINRFAFDPEFFVIAKKLGYKIKEIPIYWRNDPESKVKFKWMVNMALDLFKIRLNLMKGVYG
jgi:dolichyl-phosphate beta-glucosyltransferase